MVILDNPDPTPTAENNHGNNEVFSDDGGNDVYDLPEVIFQHSSTYPLYIHPNDNSGSKIVNVVLAESNYSEWSRVMIIALSTKIKLGNILGTLNRPKLKFKYLPYWDRCNNMLISWILNIVSSKICSKYFYTTIAKNMWEYCSLDLLKEMHLKFIILRKKSIFLSRCLSINTYYTGFKALWDEFTHMNNTLKCICNCKCGATKLLEELEHLQKLTQFLMGLNDQFTTIRGTILLITHVSKPHQSCLS